VSLHTVKPLDDALLTSVFAEFELVIVLEEHGLMGGAGSAVLEWGNIQGVDLRKLIRIGGPDRFLSACGDQQEARELLGLSSAQISRRILDRLNGRHASGT
jgi:deoxyxylulose-5-phosphate synthase